MELDHLVLDTGAIIKGETYSFCKMATNIWTVDGVIEEIRDSKSRAILETLPFEIKVRSPSPESLKAVVEFSKKSGDFSALSKTDISVIALLYTLQCEVDGMEHIRREPKAQLKSLAQKKHSQTRLNHKDLEDLPADLSVVTSFDSCNCNVMTSNSLETHNHSNEFVVSATPVLKTEDVLNSQQQDECEPTQTDVNYVRDETDGEPDVNDDGVNSAGEGLPDTDDGECECEDDEDDDTGDTGYDDDNDGLLEGGAQKGFDDGLSVPDGSEPEASSIELQPTLLVLNEDQFPSLSSTTVPTTPNADCAVSWVTMAKAGLGGGVKGGGGLALTSSAGTAVWHRPTRTLPADLSSAAPSQAPSTASNANTDISDPLRSRILGGIGSSTMGSTATSSAHMAVEDDGEHWINSSNITTHRAMGKGISFGGCDTKPPLTVVKMKVACMTTDFTMQNVCLQMNLGLCSIDGMAVKSVRQWVMRCGACLKVHYDTDKMFCTKCGSHMMQRIAASVDAKSGELKLHLRKNYQPNTRGLIYSLPKPGQQSRFQGEVLLREDQLKTGIWRQKVVKIQKDVTSAFGEDITTDLGVHINKSSDIKFGLGNRNPNAKKGRERRGKAK